MNTLAHSLAFWMLLIFGLIGLYILPSVIAVIRRVDGFGWIIVINLLPSGIGWLAALIGAVALPRREAPASFRAIPRGAESTPAKSYKAESYPVTAGRSIQGATDHQS